MRNWERSRKPKDVGRQSRVIDQGDLPYYMHHVLLMKGVVPADEIPPELGIENFASFGAQSLTAVHLEAIENHYDEWMRLEWGWQGRRHALPTFVFQHSVDTGLARREMECEVGKRYFRRDLIDFIDEQMGGEDGKWFPDLRAVVQENYVTIHHALKLLGKLQEESNRWPANLAENQRDPTSNGPWELVNGQPVQRVIAEI
jgi:hypothetical protein